MMDDLNKGLTAEQLDQLMDNLPAGARNQVLKRLENPSNLSNQPNQSNQPHARAHYAKVIILGAFAMLFGAIWLLFCLALMVTLIGLPLGVILLPIAGWPLARVLGKEIKGGTFNKKTRKIAPKATVE